MLTLKLFGTPAIRAPGGFVAGRAAQGHRIALLAVLALARGSPVTRDKLIGLLWPESATDRARHQLSDALYILRTAIGEDAIHSMGDELVLNAELVTSDVGQFERLLEEGEPEDALQLITGPLLDGFHLPNGGEFEHWLDAERARLAQSQAAALEALAEADEARGDFVPAVGWWRRLAVLDPYSGRVALRLMRALEASGDRVGAIRHARIHAVLLQDEFDAGPDPEVAAFAERLRVEPLARATPEPRAVPPALSPRPDETSPTPGALGRSTSETPVESVDEVSVAAEDVPAIDAVPVAAEDVPAPVGRAPVAKRNWPVRRIAAAMVAVLLVLALAWGYQASRAPDAVPPARRSLAVLPFVNMTADPANEYFSDGLSEQIISALSQIQDLRVVARSSSFALRDGGLDVRVIADSLGVDFVMEGSVRREGNRLRVSAQLIDAVSGYQVWSNDYDRELADVLAIQGEIAGAIAAALELRLPSRAAPSRAPNLAAYDLYLRARHLRDDLSEDALLSATNLLDRAIELEPGFALAYAERASVSGPRIFFRHVPREQGLTEMRVAITRALELDPQLGEAHVALGLLRLFYDWDWDGAGRALRRAVELNPSDPHAWHSLANHLHAVGRIEEAVEARERSTALDPLNARMRILLAVDLMAAGRLDEAVAQFERSRRHDPMNPNALGLGPAPPMGAKIYLAQGRAGEVVQELVRAATLRAATAEELDDIRRAFDESGVPGAWRSWLDMDLRQSGDGVNQMRLAILWAHIGDVDRALDWLERAHAERNPGIIFLRRERAFAALHSHPRFVRVVSAMEFPDE